MKSDQNGCSTCANGQEQYEEFKAGANRHNPDNDPVFQYDYRNDDGELFTTVAPTLEVARYRRDNWLKRPSEKWYYFRNVERLNVAVGDIIFKTKCKYVSTAERRFKAQYEGEDPVRLYKVEFGRETIIRDFYFGLFRK